MACEAQREVDGALTRFADADPGRSAAVRSLRGIEVSAGIRAEVIRPAASLVKLALVWAVRTSGLDLSARVRVDELGSTAYSSVLAVLDPGHELTLQELCGLALATSDNPAAQHLFGLVGADAVNEAAATLGAKDTRVESGFADEALGSRANVTTAHDALEMARRTVEDDPAAANALANSLSNTRIPLRLPDDPRVPHKTGTLEGVVNDAGVVFGRGTDLALAFLCDGQADPAATAIEIGDCVAAIRRAVGEPATDFKHA